MKEAMNLAMEVQQNLLPGAPPPSPASTWPAAAFTARKPAGIISTTSCVPARPAVEVSAWP